MAPRSRETLKSDNVYLALRQRIRLMQLQPGTALNKDEIAAEFGVSRAPVSDAIARLAEEGFVRVFPQHGSFVAELRAEDIRDSLFIRRALELEAVRQATALNDPFLHDTLRANLEEQEEALAAGDIRRLYHLDKAMHAAIFSAAGRGRALRMVEIARASVERMARFVPVECRPERNVQEHRCIVDAICSSDQEFASAAMRAHLSSLTAIVEARFDQLGDVPNS
jgi:DNA-binding GntR family transcriptional regulator